MPRRPGYNSRATQFIFSFNSALTYDFILMGLYYFLFYFFLIYNISIGMLLKQHATVL